MLDFSMRGAEVKRLASESRKEPQQNWKRWGTYLAERQWGTVREDYSHNGEPWEYFTHDNATWKAYRWGEDGILGWTDRQGRLCFALAMWNGKDPIIKERLFGLSGPEGNHGEDVKECYYYLDATPTHSYAKGLYKYPQSEFPYQHLVEENRRRGHQDLEFELTDTGIFDNNEYFDVFVEYCKAADEDILIRVTVANRANKAATLHLLPTFWFRNTWTHPTVPDQLTGKPIIRQVDQESLIAEHDSLGRYRIFAGSGPRGVRPRWIFTENETNKGRDKHEAPTPYGKDAFHLYLTQGMKRAINQVPQGTKAAALHVLNVPAKGKVEVCFRLCREDLTPREPFGEGFETAFEQRTAEADAFYDFKSGGGLTPQERQVLRQASAGLFWTKQFYFYSVEDWLKGMPDRPLLTKSPLPRNGDWTHLLNHDVISMPDKWEYPWYAAWDSAFHMIPFSHLDLDFAKEQLIMFLREWYMHPNGQIPAYEWNFSDVNPPVHAWACWKTYLKTGSPGKRDRVFLSRVFQKLLLNFTWWVNRKDVRGKHIFTGGFLGLDNIGVFDRSKPLPTGGHLEQADGTAWMAFFCSSMLTISFELADGNPAYADTAFKFFNHYISIAEAINTLDGTGLWDEEDEFYYDHLHMGGQSIPLRIRSIVGLWPIIAVDVIYERVVDQLPDFKSRIGWLKEHRKDLSEIMTHKEQLEGSEPGAGAYLLSIPTQSQLRSILKYMLDENEFLSEFGIRSLSKYHESHPFKFSLNGEDMTVSYVPGESDSGMFGGNSNWRGPIWFPMNYLLIEALDRYHEFYGEDFKIECPTGSGIFMNLGQVADDLRARLVKLFLRDVDGNRPSLSRGEQFRDDPHWKDLVMFYEYFHGDTGRGLGANHQTGWTALVAPILEHIARRRSTK